MYVFILITRLPDSVLLLWFEIIYRLPLGMERTTILTWDSER